MAAMFAAVVTESGALMLDEPAKFAETLRHVAGQRVEVLLRKHRTNRSLAYNDYFHAVPVAILSEYWGEDVEATKLLILGEAFGWHDTKDGHRFPMKPSSSALTNEEFSRLVDWLPTWAMQQFNVTIPLPNEVEAW